MIDTERGMIDEGFLIEQAEGEFDSEGGRGLCDGSLSLGREAGVSTPA
jgi:hypothetical protein